MPPETETAPSPGLAEHFDSYEQQRDASALGLWVFLVTEIMFFGGLFAAYILYRSLYPAAFAASSRHLNVELGATNTAILLTSSLTMALAVRSASLSQRRLAAVLIGATAVLGLAFLGIKLYEYHHKFVEGLVPGPNFRWSHAGVDARPAQIFFCLYFAMTGLHAVHMIVGIGILAALVVPAFMGKFTAKNHNFVEGTGLYWHFIDVIWIFLFPLLYLVGRHG